MALTEQTVVRINTTKNEREDHLHGVYSRAWKRLQAIVKRRKLTIAERGEQPFEYSTFGNGFHLFNKKKLVTASGSVMFKKKPLPEDPYNEEIIYIGTISFNRRTA